MVTNSCGVSEFPRFVDLSPWWKPRLTWCRNLCLCSLGITPWNCTCRILDSWPLGRKQKQRSPGRWFQIFFYFHPYLGKWSNLTNIFQMGWNHQLVTLLAVLWFFVTWNVLLLCIVTFFFFSRKIKAAFSFLFRFVSVCFCFFRERSRQLIILVFKKKQW